MLAFQSHLWDRTRAVQVKSGMYIDSHPERCVLVQTAELYSPGKYLNWKLNFINGGPMEMFKVTCGTVHELYRYVH